MAEPIIRLTGLTKHFGGGENEVAALNDINIEIQRGEIFGVIGLSGAGKSTRQRGGGRKRNDCPQPQGAAAGPEIYRHDFPGI